MANLSKFRRDPTLASEGRWCPYREGIEFKIASASQREWIDEERRTIARLKQGKPDGSEVWKDELYPALARTMARLLVRDWKNIDDENGKPIPFSIEKATEWLVDPEMSELRDFVYTRANEAREYQAAARESAAKN